MSKNNCTLFPDWKWSECCRIHGNDYSTTNIGISRYEADKKLYNCVKEKSKVIATIMFIGVRIFGRLYWNE